MRLARTARTKTTEKKEKGKVTATTTTKKRQSEIDWDKRKVIEKPSKAKKKWVDNIRNVGILGNLVDFEVSYW